MALENSKLRWSVNSSTGKVKKLTAESQRPRSLLIESCENCPFGQLVQRLTPDSFDNESDLECLRLKKLKPYKEGQIMFEDCPLPFFKV